MFRIETPTDHSSMILNLDRLSGQIGEFFAELPEQVYCCVQGDHWSPAQHLEHLNRSVAPVAMAASLPKLILGLRFGRASGSRSYQTLIATYSKGLEEGTAVASGRFLPSSGSSEADVAADRDQQLQRWRQSNERLVAVLDRWSEVQLDHYRLPHPVLGKLTIREMLFFTIYHNAHHARRVSERRVSGEELL